MSSWPDKNYQYLCPPPTPKAKVNRHSPEEVGAMTGDDYDLMLHCTTDICVAWTEARLSTPGL